MRNVTYAHIHLTHRGMLLIRTFDLHDLHDNPTARLLQQIYDVQPCTIIAYIREMYSKRKIKSRLDLHAYILRGMRLQTHRHIIHHSASIMSLVMVTNAVSVYIKESFH